jgi:hypothetical protein
MRRLALLLVAFFIGLFLAGSVSPAGAAVTTPPIAGEAGTWIGQVVPHEGHFDYVGSPCPVEAELCAEFVARYRIAPVTPQAARALPAVAGGRAALTGWLVPLSAGPHHGVLFVTRVAPAP